MRRFVLGWKKLGHEKRLEAHVVNYADDLVICCRGYAEEALARMRDIMTRLKLTVNETKTRVCKLPGEKFDFFGIYVWSVIFAEDGACASWYGPVTEAREAYLRNDQRADQTRSDPAGPGDSGGAAESRTHGMGQLLLSRASQQGLPGSGSTCREEAATVAMCQTQSGRGGNWAVSGNLPLSSVGPRPPYRADT